jgi:hypothetical protein
VGVGESLEEPGNCGRPVLAADKEAGLPFADSEPQVKGGLPEFFGAFGNEVQLGLPAPLGNSEKAKRLIPDWDKSFRMAAARAAPSSITV